MDIYEMNEEQHSYSTLIRVRFRDSQIKPLQPNGSSFYFESAG